MTRFKYFIMKNIILRVFIGKAEGNDSFLLKLVKMTLNNKLVVPEGVNEKRFGTLNLRVLPVKITNHLKKYKFV